VLAKLKWVSLLVNVDEGGALCLLYDCKRVEDSFNSARNEGSYFGAILRDCRNTLSHTHKSIRFLTNLYPINQMYYIHLIFFSLLISMQFEKAIYKCISHEYTYIVIVIVKKEWKNMNPLIHLPQGILSI